MVKSTIAQNDSAANNSLHQTAIPLMVNIALHLQFSTFHHASRIEKETKSLVENGLFDKIVIVAFWESGLEEHEYLDDKREVWRVRVRTAAWPESTEWMLSVTALC